jgi:RNA polymerase sigma-70 factor (ECF subfamily)
MENVDEEFSSVYQDYYPRIKKLCLGYIHSSGEAEDLVQETFLSAWKHWKSFKGNSSRTTWIYRIAVNKCLSHIKKANRRTHILKEVIEHPEADHPEKNENIALLYKAINELQKADRLLIIMFLDELTYNEIAEVLGMRENTVAVKIHRIKKQLTEIFNRYERL